MPRSWPPVSSVRDRPLHPPRAGPPPSPRPGLGRVWTDEARMEAWRRVEVAAAEELAGPTAEELAAIRAATFTVEAVRERERVTDHDVAAFVDVLSESAGPAG